MSLAEDLLIILTSYSGGYKLMRKRVTDYHGSSNTKVYEEIKDNTLKSTLSRLKKQGLLDNKSGAWGITKKGKKYLKNRLVSKVLHFGHLKDENNKKDTVIVFDIPEYLRKRRDWLRGELVSLNFIPLQKSVWLGPSPLPKEFIEHLNKIDILQYLKFFKATEREII